MFSKASNIFDSLRGKRRGPAAALSAEDGLRTMAQMDLIAILESLSASIHGLTDSEAAHRLQVAGPNVISFKKPPSWWLLLLMVIPNPFNILLAIIAIISVASPERSWETFAILIVMIAISSGVRFWQEYRSIISVANLQRSVTTNVKVRRRLKQNPIEPVECEIPEKNVVYGDVLLLAPGDTVPADCFIFESNYLRVSQSNMTGESMPVTKAPSSELHEKNFDTVFDIQNIAFMGTSIVSGN